MKPGFCRPSDRAARAFVLASSVRANRGDPRRPRRSPTRRPPRGWPLAGGARPCPRLRPRAGSGPHPGRADAAPARLHRCPARRLGSPRLRAAVPRAMALAAALEPAQNGSPAARQHAAAERPRQRLSPRVRLPARAASAIRRRPPSRSTAVPAAGGRRARSGREPVSAPERRRAVERLLGLWLDVARDVVLVRADGSRSVRDTVPFSRSSPRQRRPSRPAPRSEYLHRGARAARAARSECLAGADRRFGGPCLARPVPAHRRERLDGRRRADPQARCDRPRPRPGVGFRYFVLRQAQRLELQGWVANEPDGSVRCVAEGPRERLVNLEERLHEGPPSAIVERVSVAWMSGRPERWTIRRQERWSPRDPTVAGRGSPRSGGGITRSSRRGVTPIGSWLPGLVGHTGGRTCAPSSPRWSTTLPRTCRRYTAQSSVKSVDELEASGDRVMARRVRAKAMQETTHGPGTNGVQDHLQNLLRRTTTETAGLRSAPPTAGELSTSICRSPAGSGRLTLAGG